MSVIVTGIEMTGKCESCLLRYRHQGAYCTDHCYATPKRKNIDPWTFGRARNGDRPDWCPLRPLPEKHGRLISADEAYDRIMEQEGGYYIDMDGVGKGLDECRTIVEAEE